MKKRVLLFLIHTYILSISLAQQAPSIEWQNTIGADEVDWFRSVKQTVDGGYIAGGYSWSNISGDKTEACIGWCDYWIIKTDASGNIQWQRTIGGSDGDVLLDIQQSSDDGYILGGYSESNISGDKTVNSKGGFDYWIVKTDATGNIQWQKTIGGSGDDALRSLQQTADGGYILLGDSWSNISGDKTENSKGANDYWIVKVDESGDIQWQKTIGGSSSDEPESIRQTIDGGYIVGGYSSSNISGDKTENWIGLTDYWIVKTDASGNIQWQNTIGGYYDDKVSAIRQTSDGNYILGGYSASGISGDKTENSKGGSDYWILKIDANGNILWQNTIGGSGEERLGSLQQTVDGGYILGGWSSSNISGDKTEDSNGGDDYWIVKTDGSGSIQWQSTIGGSGQDDLYSILQTTDGGYILGGYSLSNISGDKTENCFGNWDYWILKLSAETGIEALNEDQTFWLTPNPTAGDITISSGKKIFISYLEIRNTLGQIIYSSSSDVFDSRFTIDISAFKAGVYMLSFRTPLTINSKMFLKD